jgi:hypothetical protein
VTKTPDRFPGSRDEDELILRSQGSDPTEAGATRYVSGDFRMRDQYGVFNPRTDDDQGEDNRYLIFRSDGGIVYDLSGDVCVKENDP